MYVEGIQNSSPVGVTLEVHQGLRLIGLAVNNSALPSQDGYYISVSVIVGDTGKASLRRRCSSNLDVILDADGQAMQRTNGLPVLVEACI
jgi:hypothetical protein